MTPADHHSAATRGTRLPLVVLLCGIALGILGMHGLASGPTAGEHSTHHGITTIVTSPGSPMDVAGTSEAPGGDQAPPGDGAGLLALCMMMLAPVLALGAWLRATAARGRGWRLPRLVTQLAASLEVAALPPPFERQLTVLRI